MESIKKELLNSVAMWTRSGLVDDEKRNNGR